MPYDYDSKDATLYPPSYVDKLLLFSGDWVRLEEYTKLWNALEEEKRVNKHIVDMYIKDII